jgi:thiosulfate dehydrogenase (quinone) large subunit
MSLIQRYLIALLRIAMGSFFFYAGITKVLDPTWSAAGYLKGAAHLEGLFSWLASPMVLPITNFLNEWGLVLLGLSLFIGLFVRLSASLGVILMALYYIVLPFPYVNEHAFVVDEHIIYILVLIILAVFHAGRYLGLDSRVHSRLD